MIVIVDYGLGNLGSVSNMLGRLGHPAVISGDPSVIANATRLILPGVGSFDTGMANLEALGITPVINALALEQRIPVLGICLGMQLLSKGSEEGLLPGLGWIDACFYRFPAIAPSGQRLRIPNIGWNYIHQEREDVLCMGLPADARFYFVHAYYAVLSDSARAVMSCEYEGFSYVCAYRMDNVCGVQFHPEKSHAFGMQLLDNFAKS